MVGANYTYSTGGAFSSSGDSLQYIFEWGDQTTSGWLPVGQSSATKFWSSTGTFLVKVKARCSIHTSIESNWSGTLIVTISAETISIPLLPNGPTNGSIGTNYVYSTGGSSSDLGHSIEYRFDWGDGIFSSWSSSTRSSKSWSSPGNYMIKAQARCVQDISIVSNWSNPLSVNISLPDISVNPMSNDFGSVKVKKNKSASFVVKNNGKANLVINSEVMGTDEPIFRISSGVGTKTIRPNKSLTIKVVFKPASAGSKSAILRITSNDPDTPTLDILLSGTGR